MFPLLLMPDCSPPKPLSRFGVDAGRLSPALIAGQAAFCFPVGLCLNMVMIKVMQSVIFLKVLVLKKSEL